MKLAARRTFADPRSGEALRNLVSARIPMNATIRAGTSLLASTFTCWAIWPLLTGRVKGASRRSARDWFDRLRDLAKPQSLNSRGDRAVVMSRGRGGCGRSGGCLDGAVTSFPLRRRRLRRRRDARLRSSTAEQLREASAGSPRLPSLRPSRRSACRTRLPPVPRRGRRRAARGWSPSRARQFATGARRQFKLAAFMRSGDGRGAASVEADATNPIRA